MIVLFAWFFDLWLGEPPARLHPVMWMGSYLAAARRARATLFAGALAWLIGATLVVSMSAILVWVATYLVALLPVSLTTQSMAVNVFLAAAFKPLFAWQALHAAGKAVLNAPDLSEARRMLSWHLVSRDTTTLSAGEVYGATIESVAENLSDSLVAPLFYFVIGGLPLAALYRYANTADAMWGYRTPDLERFGKVAARVDDLLNLIPARLTALLLVAACLPLRMNARRALRTWWQDGFKTPSPNAGQPMSIAAGALRVRLSKRGVYDLGAAFPLPERQDVARGLRWMMAAAWLTAGLFGIISIVISV